MVSPALLPITLLPLTRGRPIWTPPTPSTFSQRSGRSLVFVEKKRSATWVKKMLRNGGASDAPATERFEPIAAEDIHGDRSQSQREAALAAFRSGTCRVLVATDVAARGLDVAGVEHVINMDMPFAKDDFDSYVHRIGRTGRAGHTGLATSLFVAGEAPKQGNGKIAGVLATLLRDAKQVVPPFLIGENGGGGGGGGGNANGNGGSGNARVVSDVRGGGGRVVTAATHPAPAPAKSHTASAPERRTAPDGNSYTKAEFFAFFEGYDEWDAASPSSSPPVESEATSASNGDSAHSGRGGSGARGRGRGRGRGLPRGRG